MDKPFFSIIVPVYNVEKYLHRCVESILAQDFENYEIILVDDGSTDKSPLLCDEYSGKHSRIKTIHKPNEGLGMARNTGIENVSGEYIVFVDSDDCIKPGLLKALNDEIEKNRSDVVFYGFERVRFDGKVKFALVPAPEKMVYEGKREVTEDLFPFFVGADPETGKAFNLRLSVCFCALRAEIVKGLRFKSEREYISEDIYFCTELFGRINKVSFLKNAYYVYCQNEGSLTTTQNKNRYKRIKFFYQELSKLTESMGYCESVKIRFKNSFISAVIACLKMEAGSKNKREALANIREICSDDYMQSVLASCRIANKRWRILILAMRRRLNLFVYMICAVQYALKGI